jgi:hypothetical protein
VKFTDDEKRKQAESAASAIDARQVAERTGEGRSPLSGGSPSTGGDAGRRLMFKTMWGNPTNKTGWFIQWRLTAPSVAGGWVVQHMRAGNLQGEQLNYWEAWSVSAGKSVTDLSAILGYDDANSIRGWALGVARFYEGLLLPPSFAAGNVDSAGTAPATYIDPKLPTNSATAPNSRYFDNR